jgi:four helix bundle protein
MRRYPAAFVSKLVLSEGEAAETQVWIDFALACDYIQASFREELDGKYEKVLSMLVNMIRSPDKWKI